MNKVVAITGAAGGLGKELAKFYLEKGYQLILTDIHENGLEEFKSKGAEIIVGDLTKLETRQQLVQTVTEKYGRIDILINNAGITFIQPFEENTEEQLDTLLAIDLKAPILLTHALYPLLKQSKGHIININSTAGKEGKLNHTMYCAAKFGLVGFSASLREEAMKYGIRITSVHPGGIKTPFYDRLKNKVDTSNYMDPKEVAKIIVDLSETNGVSPDEIVINRLKSL